MDLKIVLRVVILSIWLTSLATLSFAQQVFIDLTFDTSKGACGDSKDCVANLLKFNGQSQGDFAFGGDPMRIILNGPLPVTYSIQGRFECVDKPLHCDIFVEQGPMPAMNSVRAFDRGFFYLCTEYSMQAPQVTGGGCGSTSVQLDISTLGQLHRWEASINSVNWFTVANTKSASVTKASLVATFGNLDNATIFFRCVITDCYARISNVSEAVRFFAPAPLANIITEAPKCHNGTNGSLDVIISSQSTFVDDFDIRVYRNSVALGNEVGSMSLQNASSWKLNNLSAGNYVVVVENSTNPTALGSCSKSYNTSLSNPPEFQISLQSKTNVSCFGGSNGTIQLTASNGVAPITFDWGGGVKGNPRVNCTAATYAVTATDKNFCTSTLSGIVLTQPQALVVDGTSPTPPGYNGYNVKCAGQTNGSMSASASGGTGAISYYWSSGVPGAIVGNVGVGSYTVTATDANGCQAYDNVQLSAPPPIDFSIEATPITCPGASTGSLTPQNIVNTFGLLTYLWSTGETGSSINNKPAGLYSLTITDGGGGGCSATRQQTLVDPLPFTVEVGPTSNFHGSYISCDGESDGALSATLRNTTGTPVGAQNYQWFRNNSFYEGGNALSSISSVDAGTYRVEATYGSNCIAQSTYVLNDPGPVSAQISPTSNHHGFAISCPGASDGSLLATGQGGTPGNYTYVWDNGPSTASISGISAGTYFVSVTDINGCQGSAQYDLSDPLAIVPSVAITSDYHGQAISCANASDGVLTASSMNGAAPITFAWSNGATGQVVNNVGAGAYSAVATDANGCSVESQPIQIINPTPVQASIEILSDFHGQAIRCHDESNGILRASGQGGTNTYSYLWSTAATTMEVNGLFHGNYSVIVKDQNDCSDLEIVELANPAQVIATIKSHSDFNGFGVQCNGSDNGFIEVEASGGTNEFTFSWPSLGETTPLVEHLSASTYDVIVTDNNGCIQELSYEITEPSVLEVQLLDATDVACFGESTGVISATPSGGVGENEFSLDGLSWQNSPEFTSLIADYEYQVTVRDANQCTASFTNTLQQPDEIAIEFSVTPALCGQAVGEVSALVSGGAGDFAMTWTDFEDNVIGTESMIADRNAGIYALHVIDGNSCELVSAVGIPSLDGPVLQITESKPVSCYSSGDGLATVAVIQGNGPFSISWEDDQQEWSRHNLSAGSHYASVTDVNGCIAVIPVITGSPERLVLSVLEKQDPSCFQTCDGKITVKAEGGNGDYQFTWNEQPGNNLMTGICAGTQVVRVVDKLGCGAALAVDLTSPEQVRVRAVSRKLPSCHDLCDGEIEVVASGGDGKYIYEWIAGSTTALQKNLCPGSYQVTVKDGKNCSASQQFAVGNTTKVEASLVKLQSPVCFGDCNGIVGVQAYGGAGNYEFAWGWDEPIRKFFVVRGCSSGCDHRSKQL